MIANIYRVGKIFVNPIILSPKIYKTVGKYRVGKMFAHPIRFAKISTQKDLYANRFTKMKNIGFLKMFPIPRFRHNSKDTAEVKSEQYCQVSFIVFCMYGYKTFIMKNFNNAYVLILISN